MMKVIGLECYAPTSDKNDKAFLERLGKSTAICVYEKTMKGLER